MDEDAVEKYIQRSQPLIEASPQMDEQNTRSRLIDPFLKDVLGWDFYSTDIELEYSIQMGSTKKKVDYALLVDESPAVFVEAKGCDTSLTGGHGDQLTSYMQQEWVDWGLLTNGKRFKIFKLQKGADRPRVELLGETPIHSLKQHQWVINALSKESVESGHSDTVYRNVERRRNAIKSLSENKNELSDTIRQLVVEQAGDVVSQPAESLSKELIDELIEELENGGIESNFSANTSNPQQESKQKPSSEDTYQATVHVDGDSATFADTEQGGLMAMVTEYLIEEHQLIDRLQQFPYVPGKKNAVLNDEPNHPNGEEMRLYRSIADGYYVYTSLNKESKKRHLERFVECCDGSIEFAGRW